jgi:hypothetical protein
LGARLRRSGIRPTITCSNAQQRFNDECYCIPASSIYTAEELCSIPTQPARAATTNATAHYLRLRLHLLDCVCVVADVCEVLRVQLLFVLVQSRGLSGVPHGGTQAGKPQQLEPAGGRSVTHFSDTRITVQAKGENTTRI